MLIQTLSIENLRNHTQTTLHFDSGITVFHGHNGAGKTTILEAIAICGFTKSFLPVSDSAITRYDESGYSIGVEAMTDLGIPYRITVTSLGKKIIHSSISDNVSSKDVIGAMPIVIVSPDLKIITSGSPTDRRAFIDRVLSQASKRYYDVLTQQRRILKQRNHLLSSKSQVVDKELVEVWTQNLIEINTKIFLYRRDFLQEFLPVFQQAYSTISPTKEVVSLRYVADSIDIANMESDKDVIFQNYTQEAKRLAAEELRRGTTLWGTQKDEIEFTINGGIAREAASQGQHKSLLISIKSAEFQYLISQRNETPILLLDDVFSELDEERTKQVFSTIIRVAKQIFITTTEAPRLASFIPADIPLSMYKVIAGNVQKIV